jgi:hypothetical protein
VVPTVALPLVVQRTLAVQTRAAAMLGMRIPGHENNHSELKKIVVPR